MQICAKVKDTMTFMEESYHAWTWHPWRSWYEHTGQQGFVRCCPKLVRIGHFAPQFSIVCWMWRVHTVFDVTSKWNVKWTQVSWIWVPSKVSPTSTPDVIETLVSVVTYFRSCNVMLEYEYNMKWSVPTFNSWGRINCCRMSRYGTQRIVSKPGFNFQAFPLKPEETRPLSVSQTARLRILTMEGHSEGVYIIQ